MTGLPWLCLWPKLCGLLGAAAFTRVESSLWEMDDMVTAIEDWEAREAT